ncbi:PrgI family mobile element protein [Bacillus sp. SM2101]|uniref:PrgI family mobile element protein n=1 Tax=Bacillus sp. SM2101 TaxID=2805366 RepID=UPI001BDEA62E|nr:PrgI family protein [Bacillus sp. SM2101]
MRRETVPEDMSSEQKVILGFISMRQLIYLLVGFFVIGAYIGPVFTFFSTINWVLALIASIISTIPVVAVILPLAFLKKGKYHMFFDRYLLTKMSASSQRGVWRKGSNSTDWMEDLK